MRSPLFLSLAALALASCSEPTARRQSPPAPAKAVPVQAIDAVTEQWPALYQATGTVRARASATLSSKITAYVQQVSVQAGDLVRPGQVLLTLETRDLDAAHRRAEIARAEVQSSIPEADYAISGAKASLDLAAVTMKRVEDLAAKKSLSTQEFDEASARFKAAQSNYEMARARRAQLDTRLAQADQDIRTAAIARDYARISAPFAGTVTSRTVEPGTLASPATPLLVIERDGAYRLEASVDESRIGSVRLGQSLPVELDAVDRKVNGRISEIAPSVDSGSRSYLVKLDLPAIPQLRSGMFGRASIPLAARPVLTVPASAVTARDQLQTVMVAENGSARTRMVTLGQRANASVEVLSGLSAGEKVIAPLPAGLRDGSPVELRQEFRP